MSLNVGGIFTKNNYSMNKLFGVGCNNIEHNLFFLSFLNPYYLLVGKGGLSFKAE